MKKAIALFCALVLMMSFAACGAKSPAPEVSQPAEVTPEPTLEEIMEASATNASAMAEAAPPASATDTAMDTAAYETAQSLIGASVEELIAAIGEPTDSQYASSCLEEGAEDGMLFYEGFYVWSLRNGAEETVHAVYIDG